jgi:DNA-directed RNA polymerase specialized sigma subunit
LESCAKSYDPQRGQFENYAKAAVKKAMLKKLKGHRILELYWPIWNVTLIHRRQRQNRK